MEGAPEPQEAPGLVVVHTYEPKYGKEHDLLTALLHHSERLQTAELLLSTVPLYLRSSDGHVIEFVEYKDKGAVKRAGELHAIKEPLRVIQDASPPVPLALLLEATEAIATFNVLDMDTLSPSGRRAIILATLPRQDCEDELLRCIRAHDIAAYKLHLTTSRTPLHMRAASGHVLCVTEWTSEVAIREAATMEELLDIRSSIANLAATACLRDVSAAHTLVSEFRALRL